MAKTLEQKLNKTVTRPSVPKDMNGVHLLIVGFFLLYGKILSNCLGEEFSKKSAFNKYHDNREEHFLQASS